MGAVVLAGIGIALAAPGPGPTSSSTPGPSPTQSTDSAFKLAATFAAPDGGYIHYAFFSLDGSMAAGTGTGTDASKVYVWNATARKYVTTLAIPKGGTAQPLCFTPDDKYLIAVDTKNYIVYRFNIATGQATNVREVPSAAWNVSSDASTLANEVLAGNAIDVFSTSSGKLMTSFKNPTTAATVPDTLYLDSNGGELLISAQNDETYVIDVQTGQTLASFHYNYALAKSNDWYPTISPDGKTVYIPDPNTGQAQIWDVGSKSDITPHDSRWPAKDNGVIFSTDGLTMLTSPANADYLDLWNVSTRTHIGRAVIPGSQSYYPQALGPGNSELLMLSTYDNSVEGSKQLFLYDVP